jgi:conjugal transfer pilus assembly protein TraV
LKLKITRRLLGTSLLLGVVAGCNPYNSEFACKNAPFGKCSSTPDIYTEITDHKVKVPKVDADTGLPVSGEKEVALVAIPEAESAYREAELKKVTKLLKRPVTPVLVPPTVMRILYLPFEGEDGDVLNMPSYAYLILDKPRFVMGEYLVQQAGEWR